MNYQRIHDQIVERAKTRKLTGYKERHHIIPRCMGGTNDEKNLVDLTAREHFIVHKLLCEIYPDNDKLFFAYRIMAVMNSDSQQRDYNISSREFSYIRELSSKIISKQNKGRTAWNKGKTNIYSAETIRKISDTLKGNVPWNKGKTNIYSNETIELMKQSALTKKISVETENQRREKIRNTMKRKKPMAKTVFDTRTNKNYNTVNEFRRINSLSEYSYMKLRNAGIIIVK